MVVEQQVIKKNVEIALTEDVGTGDITAELLAKDTLSQAQLVCRETAILCGQAWFNETFQQLDDTINVNWLANDGDNLSPEQPVCHIKGNSRALLTGERTAINFLQTFSGTATTVHHYVELIKGTNTKLLDTRKTIPGLRRAQKYAVSCGGGKNHRIGLFDAYLIKENHILAKGSIANAVNEAKKTGQPVEVEVENMQELEQALMAKANRILLDNFSLDNLRAAVKKTQGQAELEASGNITEDNLREIALTGVDYISIGALTKHIKAIDFSLRFE